MLRAAGTKFFAAVATFCSIGECIHVDGYDAADVRQWIKQSSASPGLHYDASIDGIEAQEDPDDLQILPADFGHKHSNQPQITSYVVKWSVPRIEDIKCVFSYDGGEWLKHKIIIKY